MQHAFPLPRLARGLAALTLLAAPALAQTDYHDQPVLYQWGRFLALKKDGYRMVSLDVAGNLDDHRWSAVWEKRGGPDWIANFGVGGTDYALWRLEQIQAGYRDQWVTSSGDGLKRVYGGIMVKDQRKTLTLTDMSQASFDSAKNTAHELGYLLASASMHGTAAAPRFAAVWVENPEAVRWGMSTNDTSSEYQAQFSAFVSGCWARPAIVCPADYNRYLSVFHDDQIGTWVARHNMTKAGYESEKTTLAKSGYRPYQIMVGGLGNAARYAALFVKGSPAAQSLTITGTQVPALSAIDTRIAGASGFMRATNARECAVAIARHGKLVFARAYTYAAPGWPTAQPTTGFRLASGSKPLTAFATYHLAANRSNVGLGSRLVDLVPLGTPKDAKAANITLQQLIDHRSGYNDYWGDGLSNKLSAAQSSFQNATLSFTPGTSEAYSNGGYMMLGLAIERQSGLSYFNYMRGALLAPLGITRAHLMTQSPLAGDARCNEARWGGSHALGVWKSPVLTGNPLVNGAYAVSSIALDASGGVVMSAVDYVRMLSGVFDRNVTIKPLSTATLDLLEANIETSGRTGGFDKGYEKSYGGKKYMYYEKGGLWRSAHTYVVRRSDGISIAAFCTGPSAPPIGDINAAVDAVTSWPTHDLFPSYGLASFPLKKLGVIKKFGVACIGSAGFPVHASHGTAEIGQTQTFAVTGVPANTFAILNLGFSNQRFGALPLPLPLDFVGARGCNLYVDPLITVPVSTGRSGVGLVHLKHSALARYVGLRFFTQFTVLDPKANAWGATYSDALETELGG